MSLAPDWLTPWLAAHPRVLRAMVIGLRREAETLTAQADALEAELMRRGWSATP